MRFLSFELALSTNDIHIFLCSESRSLETAKSSKIRIT